MSDIYLIRHGQAGTREAYDSLSELGRRQSRLLGEWLASQEIKFTAAYSGEMSRQKETAREVSAGYGDKFPSLMVDRRWNEFDLERLYREIAPQLCAESDDFRREFEAMNLQARASSGEEQGSVHRRWLPCDSAMVAAWIHGTHQFGGESWPDFHRRISACGDRLRAMNAHESVAVFTSATPISILTGLTLDVRDGRVMRLAGAMHNASFTILEARGEELRLMSFNATPHLDADQRTFR